MKIAVYDLTGKETKTLNLDETVFGNPVNAQALKQAVRVYASNQRIAAAKTKTRSRVLLTGAKIYKQKGTGNARHGSKRAPLFVGGSKAHGPKPEQNYKMSISKKLKNTAFVSALSLYAQEKRLSAIEGMDKLETPKTKNFTKVITILREKSGEYKIALIIPKGYTNAYKSLRNLKNVQCYQADTLTTHQILRNKHIAFAPEAVEILSSRVKTTKPKTK
jgi:large subunit ribosomal protein L4